MDFRTIKEEDKEEENKNSEYLKKEKNNYKKLSMKMKAKEIEFNKREKVIQILNQ